MRDNKTPGQQSAASTRRYMQQMPSGGNGVVISYDDYTNTATVLLAQPDSDAQGEVITNVICPVIVGVQQQAPEAGRGCWVQFKGGDMGFPMITHFFNYNYETFDYGKQARAVNSTPRFMLDI